MSTQEQFDQRARGHYRDAAAALSPGMHGRLRAARRTALSGAPGSVRHGFSLAMPAMAAAVMALALGLRLQAPDRAGGDGSEEVVGPVAGGPAVTVPSPVQPTPAQQDSDTLLSMLDEDPDFYLWLGSDDSLPPTPEQRHDPS